jgi:hypothetical protein
MDIPPGKVLNADFVGKPLRNWYRGLTQWGDYWETSILDSVGGVLHSVQTDPYNPRKTAVYQNSGAGTISVYVRVQQNLNSSTSEDRNLARPYSVAFRVCTGTCEPVNIP